jgi:hypothetical protein
MKFEEGMMFFELKADEGENIEEILSKIPNDEKRFSPDENAWMIRNKHLGLVKKLLLSDRQTDLF